MTAAPLRVVKDGASDEIDVPETDLTEPQISVTDFDPELDLGPLEEENGASDQPEPKSPHPLARLFRFVAYGFIAVIVLFAGLIMTLRGGSLPSNTPPLTARVEVLEAAMQPAPVHSNDELNGIDTARPLQHERAEPTTATPTSPETIARGNVLPIQDQSNAEQDPQAAEPLGQPQHDVLAIIAELRQITDETRAGYAEERAHIRTMQEELLAIRTSSEATNLRVDQLVADVAQVRHSLEDLTKQKSRQMSALQQQLSHQQKRLEVQQAVREERPPFQLSSVTQWGGDYLANVSLNGMSRELGQGDVFEGWKITGINANSISVVRLRDGVAATLQWGG